MMGAKTKRRSAWIDAIEVAPKVLPNAMAERETGATKISFRKPNSRSQTVEMVEKKATPITDIAKIPGYINFTKSTPKFPAAKVDCKPKPKIAKNISG
jgi:hypothetical protein